MSIRVVLCAIVVADLFCAYLSSCVGFMKVPVSFALNRVRFMKLIRILLVALLFEVGIFQFCLTALEIGFGFLFFQS